MSTQESSFFSRSSARQRGRSEEHALRKLMALWESEPQSETETEENEIELMIQLSGMVGGHGHGYDAS